MVLGWLILKVVMRNIWKAKIKIEQKIYNAEKCDDSKWSWA